MCADCVSQQSRQLSESIGVKIEDLYCRGHLRSSRMSTTLVTIQARHSACSEQNIPWPPPEEAGSPERRVTRLSEGARSLSVVSVLSSV